MPSKARSTRHAFSLLELIVTATIMSLLVTAVSIVLRSSQNAWEGHSADHQSLESGHAVVRHLVRKLRQAERVVAISDPADVAGSITVQMPRGNQSSWALAGDRVLYRTAASSGLLAEGIWELSFVGYAADGLTRTSIPEEIRSVRIRSRAKLARSANANQLISSWVWLRSW